MKKDNLIIANVNVLKKTCLLLLVFVSLLILYSSCKKDQQISTKTNERSIEEKLKAAGFDLSRGFQKYKNGYIVERDIFITEEQINNLSKKSKVEISLNSGRQVRMGSGSQDPTSHYVTNDFLYIGSGRRTISVYMDSSFGTYMQSAFDDAIARFNALDLSLEFARASSSSADIIISPSYIDPNVSPSTDYLGLGGFPSGGNPYNQIYLNTYYYNSSTNRSDATSVIAHEIGHAIGFRHTDYMDRSFSGCPIGSGYNEGVYNIGANHVAGTSTGPSANSWMLACSGGFDRPFTQDDILALLVRFSYNKNIYVKVIRTLLYNNSYYTTYNDYEDEGYNTRLEFYQDALCTIPYETNYFFLNVRTMYNSSVDTNVLLNNGITYYDLGTQIQNRTWEYGNLVSDNSSGTFILGASHYTVLMP